MQKIKKLSQEQIQKIAAGEVVERPANVIKELVENSIDAGATTISIFVEQAGQKKIQIIDNGCGMSPEDAQLCFEHHTTSKITTVDELQTIDTFGFRGEALSSISAVSKVTLLTKTADAQHGTQIIRADKTIEACTAQSCNTGTSLIVEDIFYNVPARKKFLKKPETEWRHISTLFQAFCFDYPSIHFKLYSEGKLIHNCPAAATLHERVAQLWDIGTAEKMLTLQAKTAYCTVNGIISNHQHMRYDRNQFYFFVNKRWVKNFELSKALLKGYMNVLPQGRYPSAIIDITIDQHELDVNIHPRKEEIQFVHPRRIETQLTDAVKKTLEENLSQQLQQTVSFKPQQNFTHTAFTTTFTKPEPAFNFNFAMPAFTDKPSRVFETPNLFVHTDDIKPFNVIGQFKKTYIILEHADGLFMIDQHAAHERILYQRFIDRFGATETVTLLFPCIITLSEQDLATVLTHKNLFIKHGIALEEFGHNQLRITATPVHVKDIPLPEFISEIISWITEHKDLKQEEFFKLMHERMHAQMACKAAIKAGDVMSHEQMQKLLDDLYATSNRFSCPHGRPTGWLLSLDDIERKFKRKL